MIQNTISIHSGSDAQNAAVTNEMEASLDAADDPLAILIAEENVECECTLPMNRCIDCPRAK